MAPSALGLGSLLPTLSHGWMVLAGPTQERS